MGHGQCTPGLAHSWQQQSRAFWGLLYSHTCSSWTRSVLPMSWSDSRNGSPAYQWMKGVVSDSLCLENVVARLSLWVLFLGISLQFLLTPLSV